MKVAAIKTTKCLSTTCQRVVPEHKWRAGQRWCRECSAAHQGKLFEPRPLSPRPKLAKQARVPSAPRDATVPTVVPPKPTAVDATNAYLSEIRAAQVRALADARTARLLELRHQGKSLDDALEMVETENPSTVEDPYEA